MMKKCRVKPGYFQCGNCLDRQVMMNVVYPSSECEVHNRVYDVVKITDKHVIVMDEKGHLSRVGFDRVTIIKGDDSNENV